MVKIYATNVYSMVATTAIKYSFDTNYKSKVKSQHSNHWFLL